MSKTEMHISLSPFRYLTVQEEIEKAGQRHAAVGGSQQLHPPQHSQKQGFQGYSLEMCISSPRFADTQCLGRGKAQTGLPGRGAASLCGLFPSSEIPLSSKDPYFF